MGDDADENGCVGSAGYTWCEPLAKCLRAWEEPCESDDAEPQLVGADEDEYGCISSAGFQWCNATQECERYVICVDF